MRHSVETERYTVQETVEKPVISPSDLHSAKATLPKAYKALVEDQERLIQCAQKQPYKLGAYLVGFFYLASVSVLSLGLWVKGLFKPLVQHQTHEQICTDLAEAFYYVPEMAIHKAIELQAFFTDIENVRQADDNSPYFGKGIDLGCGQGVVGSILMKRLGLNQFIGLDFYAHNETLVKDRGYHDFIAADIGNIPVQSGAFDYAISVCVIEHLEHLDRALSEVTRVLKPGGRLSFTTPSPQFRTSTLAYRLFKAIGWNQKALEFQVFKDVHAMHYNYFSKEVWVDLLQHLGYQDIEVTPIFSRAQLAWYDLLNSPVYFLKFYFYDKLCLLSQQNKALRQWLSWVTFHLAAGLSQEVRCPGRETHFYIACTKA